MHERLMGSMQLWVDISLLVSSGSEYSDITQFDSMEKRKATPTEVRMAMKFSSGLLENVRNLKDFIDWYFVLIKLNKDCFSNGLFEREVNTGVSTKGKLAIFILAIPICSLIGIVVETPLTNPITMIVAER